MSLHLEDFKLSLAAIKPYITKTPLVRCEAFERHLGTHHKVFLKLESEQVTKSFKPRGAFNALLCLSSAEKTKGIVTSSSGNFAQAVAYAGKLLKIKANIVMPMNAPEIKKRETQKYEPNLILAGITHEEGDLAADKIHQATGAVKISPYNHLDVIKGQGSIALEVYEELQAVQHFFCPIGGGGLMSGCAAALKLIDPAIETIGIEPDGASDYYQHRLGGDGVALKTINTICDGLGAPKVGALNLPLLDNNVDVVKTVHDRSVIQAMKLLRDHGGWMIEPSGAAALAGLLEYDKPFQGDVVCVISGANITQSNFDELVDSL